ncbi:MAG TPA: glycosyltransferase [Gemmataceae bacterium]|jgi:predicted glycosyltransferase|nr:glycosyltransferase [Gemmataceae bacterium]
MTAPAGPPVLFYTQSIFGAGHWVRSAALAAAIARRLPVVLVSGGRLDTELGSPPGVTVERLAPLEVNSNGHLVAALPKVDLHRTWERRLRQLEGLLERYRPGCLLVEYFPFDRHSMAAELTGWFAASRELSRPPLIVCSLRDIQQTCRKNQATFDSRIGALVDEYFDAVLVHSDPAWLTLRDTFSAADRLGVEVVHTGFVVSGDDVPARPAVPDPRVVVSAGGGRGGEELLFAAVESQRSGGLAADFEMEVYAGTALPAWAWDNLATRAAGVPRLTLRRWTENLRERLATAAVSVSRCGYNTALDLLRTRVPALVVPADLSLGNEQTRRAELLARNGLVRVLVPGRTDPATLAAEIRRTAAFRPAGAPLDLAGGDRSTEWLAARLAEWASGRRPPRWALRDPDRLPTQPRRLPGELWGVVPFWTEGRGASRPDDLFRTTARLRSQGLPVLVVELALGDAPFVADTAAADRILQVRAETVVWPRERLVNLGVAALPPGCDKVVWIDPDLTFENDRWIGETTDRLNRWPVVQPFQAVSGPGGRTVVGYVYRMTTAPPPAEQPANMAGYVTGEMGGAWAACRELITRHPLYEATVLGRADVLFGHVLLGGDRYWEKTNRHRLLFSRAQFAHLAVWGKALAAEVRGAVGFTPGRAIRLGDSPAVRDRDDDLLLLREAGFDPGTDLVSSPDGWPMWRPDRADLAVKVRDYLLYGRKEDG